MWCMKAFCSLGVVLGEEPNRIFTEDLGNALYRPQGQVPLPPLDSTHVCTVDLEEVSEGLL